MVVVVWGVWWVPREQAGLRREGAWDGFQRTGADEWRGVIRSVGRDPGRACWGGHGSHLWSDSRASTVWGAGCTSAQSLLAQHWEELH